MRVYVLLDSDGKVDGVVTDPVIAEEWLTFDDTFAIAAGELNDFACFNVALEASAKSESCSHLKVPRAQEPA